MSARVTLQGNEYVTAKFKRVDKPTPDSIMKNQSNGKPKWKFDLYFDDNTSVTVSGDEEEIKADHLKVLMAIDIFYGKKAVKNN